MNILITQHRLTDRGDSELYTLELAHRLIQQGHCVIVYCPRLGPLADTFLEATIPVVDCLSSIEHAPDIIHGQSGMETLTAMIRFAETPVVYVMHDWSSPFDRPPLLARIRKYVAVEKTCFDRLTLKVGCPAERATILQPTVDTKKFWKRKPLPDLPKQGLFYSDDLDQGPLADLQAACDQHGIALDRSAAVLKECEQPLETILPKYDLVFAHGRCAAEALAVGCAVVLCSQKKSGPMISSNEVEQFSRFNFGMRLVPHNHSQGRLSHVIKTYDAADADITCNWVRETAESNHWISQLVELYESAINEYKSDQNFWTTLAKLTETQQIAEFLSAWSKDVDLVGINRIDASALYANAKQAEDANQNVGAGDDAGSE